MGVCFSDGCEGRVCGASTSGELPGADLLSNDPGGVMIHWFRNDLRLHDNACASHALLAASKGRPYVFLYILDPRFLDASPYGRVTDPHFLKSIPCRKPVTFASRRCGALRARFYLGCLRSLDKQLRCYGASLLVCKGLPEDVFVALQLDRSYVMCQAEPVSVEHTDVEDRVEKELHKRGGVLMRTPGCMSLYNANAISPLLKNTPETFSSFANWLGYEDAWSSSKRTDWAPEIPSSKPAPATTIQVGLPVSRTCLLPGIIPPNWLADDEVSLGVLGYTPTEIADAMQSSSVASGELSALDELEAWCKTEGNENVQHVTSAGSLLSVRGSSPMAVRKLSSSVSSRDLSDTTGWTRMSKHLAIGCLSPRKLFWRANGCKNHEGVAHRLLWREWHRFNAMVWGRRLFWLQGPGRVERSWSWDAPTIACWKAGRTGVPYIDACMRELQATGWIAQEGRKAVAHFLVHNLGVDWRVGAAWFEELLLDSDCAINYGNWVTIAGVDHPQSGTGFLDDGNYKLKLKLRAEKIEDPSGEYIRRWVPELQNTPKDYVHWPWLQLETQRPKGYPASPIIAKVNPYECDECGVFDEHAMRASGARVGDGRDGANDDSAGFRENMDTTQSDGRWLCMECRRGKKCHTAGCDRRVTLKEPVGEYVVQVFFLPVTEAPERHSKEVAKLHAGDCVSVVEVTSISVEEPRYRGRIEKPKPGYISLRNTRGGHVWAMHMAEEADTRENPIWEEEKDEVFYCEDCTRQQAEVTQENIGKMVRETQDESGEFDALRRHLRSKNRDVRLETLTRIKELGASALPLMNDVAKRLADEDQGPGGVLQNVLPVIGDLLEARGEVEIDVSADPLGKVGQLLAHEATHIRVAALLTLQKLSETTPAIIQPLAPLLAPQLKDKNPVIRQKTILTLGRLAEAATPFLPDIARALDDAESDVRNSAYQALKELGPVARKTALQALADSGSPRRKCVDTLTDWPAAAKPADSEQETYIGAAKTEVSVSASSKDDFVGDEVEALLDGSSPDIRNSARETIRKTKGEAAELEALRRQLQSMKKDILVEALNRVREIGNAAAPLTDDIVYILADEDSDVSITALRTLGNLGLAARKAALQGLGSGNLGPPDPKTSSECRNIRSPSLLVKLGVPTAECGAELMKWLEDLDVEAKVAALRLLEQMGVSGATLDHDVLSLVESPRAEVRTAAREMIRTTQGEQVDLEAIRRQLQSGERSVKLGAVKRIHELGADAAPLVDELVALLNDPDGSIGGVLMRATRELGNIREAQLTAGKTVQILYAQDVARLLERAEPHIREASLYTLQKMAAVDSTKVEPLAPVIAKHLMDTHKGARHLAMLALGKLGKSASPYVEQIGTGLEADCTFERVDAMDALKSLKVSIPSLVVAEPVKRLNHQNKDVRKDAVLLLGDFAEEVSPSEVALVQKSFQEDSDPLVRETASKALENMRLSDLMRTSGSAATASFEPQTSASDPQDLRRTSGSAATVSFEPQTSAFDPQELLIDPHMRVDVHVMVGFEFSSHTTDPQLFEVGQHGTVKELDGVGDALIDFHEHEQLQWVNVGDFGNLNVLATLTAGDVITVQTAFVTSTEDAPLETTPGQHGVVIEVDEDGDALVVFEGSSSKHWITGEDFCHLEGGICTARPGARLVVGSSRPMQTF